MFAKANGARDLLQIWKECVAVDLSSRKRFIQFETARCQDLQFFQSRTSRQVGDGDILAILEAQSSKLASNTFQNCLAVFWRNVIK